MIDLQFYTVRPPFSLIELADRFNVELPSDGLADEKISAPADLGTSHPGDVAFFSNKRLKDQLLTAKATACLTTEKLAPLVSEAGIVAIVTKDPRAAFAKLSGEMVAEGAASLGESTIDPSAEIHPSAVIGEGVTIGARTRIGANCVIQDGVVLGEDCFVEPLVCLSFTKLGDRCRIKSGAVIGGTGFGMVEEDGVIFNIPHLGRVIIHDDVQIGSNSCIDRGQLGDTVIMNSVKIDNLVQIGHNVFIDEGAMLAGHVGVSGSCRIGKKALFGGRASTADHVNVGDGSILAASAGVMNDIPDGEMWSGIPAMPIREHMRSVAAIKKLIQRK